MTSVNGISALTQLLHRSAGAQSATTGANGAPATPAGSSLAANATHDLFDRVRNRFASSVSSVLADAASGAYDDPDLAARSAKLRAALAGGTSGTSQAGDGAATIGSPPATTGGAHAAPVVEGTGGAGAAPSIDVASTQHELATIDVAQAESRLAKVHSSLTQRFAAGASLPSAATGALDYHHFQPRSREEADAFAQRMAIDVTEGAASLEVTATRLQLAKLDAASAPTDATRQAQVAALQQQYAAQEAHVTDMVAVMDAKTNGAISSATPPAAPDRAMAAVVAASVDDGLDAQTIDKLSRMHTIVVEEATQPGGSKHLTAAVTAFADAMRQWVVDEQRRMEQRQHEEAQRYEEHRADERHYERSRSERTFAEAQAQRWVAEHASEDNRAMQQSAALHAEQRAYLNRPTQQAS